MIFWGRIRCSMNSLQRYFCEVSKDVRIVRFPYMSAAIQNTSVKAFTKQGRKCKETPKPFECPTTWPLTSCKLGHNMSQPLCLLPRERSHSIWLEIGPTRIAAWHRNWLSSKTKCLQGDCPQDPQAGLCVCHFFRLLSKSTMGIPAILNSLCRRYVSHPEKTIRWQVAAKILANLDGWIVASVWQLGLRPLILFIKE